MTTHTINPTGYRTHRDDPTPGPVRLAVSAGNMVVKVAATTAVGAGRGVRAVASGVVSGVSAATRTMRRSSDKVADEAAVQARTVTGRARYAANEMSNQARGVTGQARAAVRDTAEMANEEFSDAADRASAAARREGRRGVANANRATSAAARDISDSPGSGVPYEQWSRSDLYERAQELDVSGRSGMSKDELIAALRSQ